MRATWLIATKEAQLQLRNRSILVLGFVAPLTLAFVLDLVFGGVTDPEESITFDVGLAAVDTGDAAAGFTATVEEIAASGVLDLTRYDDEAAARSAVSDGEVGAAWVVPEGFSASAGSGGDAEILVIADVDSPTATSVARAIADRYATRIDTGTLAGLVAAETGAVTADEIGTVAQEVAAGEPPIQLAPLDEETELLDATTTLTAGLALFFVFFTAGMPLVSILQEREQGTLARLLVAPIPAAAVRAGKTLASILLGVVSLISLMVASSVLMGTEWGPPLGAVLLATAAVIAVSGIMIVAGSVARTTEQAGNTQAITAIVFGFLGGAFVPSQGPRSGLLGVLEMLTPNGWFLEGLRGLRHEGLGAILLPIGVLCLMGLVAGATGLALSRSVLRR